MQRAERDGSKFPVLPAKTWWQLRNQFKKSMPKQASAGYVASLLSVSQRTASDNILPRLRTLGLIDEDSVPTERANRWRDDEQYGAVCDEIRHEVYPDELTDLYSSPTSDRSAIARWFSNQTRVGSGTASQMAALYSLLLEADPTKAISQDGSKRNNKSTRPIKAKTAKVVHHRADRTDTASQPNGGSADNTAREPRRQNTQHPSVHVDIQIHITPDITTDQIDAIFASMARHLYRTSE